MLPKPESACFVIADISGYTSYLAGVELDQAQDIIADVMGTVVRGPTAAATHEVSRFAILVGGLHPCERDAERHRDHEGGFA